MRPGTGEFNRVAQEGLFACGLIVTLFLGAGHCLLAPRTRALSTSREALAALLWLGLLLAPCWLLGRLPPLDAWLPRESAFTVVALVLGLLGAHAIPFLAVTRLLPHSLLTQVLRLRLPTLAG
ncbi:MAG: hypothetical protein ACOC3I_02255 [Verrucomicrobiota bacterium]